MSEAFYSNTIPRAISRPAHGDRSKCYFTNDLFLQPHFTLTFYCIDFFIIIMIYTEQNYERNTCFSLLIREMICLFISNAINFSSNTVFSEKECVNDERNAVCVVVLLSVLFFLSLLANAALAFLCGYTHVTEYQLCLHCVSVSQYYFMLHRLHQ